MRKEESVLKMFSRLTYPEGCLPSNHSLLGAPSIITEFSLLHLTHHKWKSSEKLLERSGQNQQFYIQIIATVFIEAFQQRKTYSQSQNIPVTRAEETMLRLINNTGFGSFQILTNLQH